MNFLPLFIKYPSWISPSIFPGVPVLEKLHWYGLMYIFAFATAYFLLMKQQKEGALDSKDYKCSQDDVFSFLACGIIFLLLGARIFSTLVYSHYDPSDPYSVNYWTHPWLIFWPFDTKTHQFTGLAGMSYHGGFIGGLIGMIVWCAWKKKPVLKWLDAMVLAIPLGYTFGRLGNFMNGELYGRITTMPWGMVFPGAERFPASEQWVQDFAAKAGMTLDPVIRMVNLPRHPSQLYEAFFEGIVLWCSMWFWRKKKPFDGFFAGMYTAGYGIIRFVIEYFRQPDADMGYKISPTDSTVLYQNTSLLNISTGQILCFIMIVGGMCLILGSWFYSKKQAEKLNGKTEESAKASK